MKRILMILVAVVMVLAIAEFAVAQSATSVNAVAVMRTTVPDGGWRLIGLPLCATSTGDVELLVEEILPEAPDGTRAWYFDVGEQKWDAEQKVPFVGWDPGTNKFIRGDGLFINAPSGGGEVTYSMQGEVPSERIAPTTTVFLGEGWTLVGFCYPVDTPLTNTVLNTTANDGDQLWWYTDNGWTGATKVAFVGWDPANTVLKAGAGYFYSVYSTASSFDWTEVKKDYYDWP